jgi:prophage regulatory protein
MNNPLFSAFFEGFRPSRQREKLSHALYRLCEARNECAAQDIGGSSGSETVAPVRAPRTQRRAARKPATGDDGDSEPAPRSHIRPLFYGLDDVAAVLSLSTRGVQRLVQEGNFPKPRAVSTRRVAWLVREIEEWAELREFADMLPPANAGQRRAA